MKKDHQAILARDIIDMVRDYSDDADALEYLDSFCFSIARIVEKGSTIPWDTLANICDQRYYSIKQSKPLPLDTQSLDAIYAQCTSIIAE